MSHLVENVCDSDMFFSDQGEDYDSQEESHQSFSDHHSGRHSVGDTVSYRRDPDGLDETEIHNHQQDSYRNSYDDDSHSG